MSTEPEITGAVVPSSVTPPPEGGLSPLARAAIDAGISAETRRAYERDWREFTGWCAREGRQPLPASPETLAEYVTYLCYTRPVRDRGGLIVPGAVGVSPTSAKRMIGSVQALHKHAGLPSPRTGQVSLILKGYETRLADERDPRARPRKVTPLTPALLAEMTGRGLQGEQELIRLRDAAMFYLDYCGATRASELPGINVEDVAGHEFGIVVTIRRPKTKARMPYTDVKIPAEDAPETVAAVRKWIAALAARGRTSGPLFPQIRRNGTILPDSITPDAARMRMRLAAQEAGLEGRITPHSGRRGLVTQATLAGHPLLAITRHIGYSDDSRSAKGYADDAAMWTMNPLKGAGA